MNAKPWVGPECFYFWGPEFRNRNTCIKNLKKYLFPFILTLIINNYYLFIFTAYGFSLVKGSLVVHATLMNTKLQTPVIPVNSNEIKFSNEIIWTMENSELKKY